MPPAEAKRWRSGSSPSGDGVPRDDIKAYDYFSQIVTNYDEDDPNRRDLAIVSSAFVAIGIYNLNGIANTKVHPDPQRAIQMFQFAATNFGDADAQYNWHACISTALEEVWPKTRGQRCWCTRPPMF